MAPEGKRALLKAKLADAKKLLTIAEQELNTGMRGLLNDRGDEKTLVAKVLEDALSKLREARRHVAELKKLVDEVSSE
jgi:hypothetical protein